MKECYTKNTLCYRISLTNFILTYLQNLFKCSVCVEQKHFGSVCLAFVTDDCTQPFHFQLRLFPRSKRLLTVFSK